MACYLPVFCMSTNMLGDSERATPVQGAMRFEVDELTSHHKLRHCRIYEKPAGANSLSLVVVSKQSFVVIQRFEAVLLILALSSRSPRDRNRRRRPRLPKAPPGSARGPPSRRRRRRSRWRGPCSRRRRGDARTRTPRGGARAPMPRGGTSAKIRHGPPLSCRGSY